MTLRHFMLMLAMVILPAPMSFGAADGVAVVQRYLEEETKQSGTLDIFDESINKVRNLKVLEFPQEVAEKDGQLTASQTFTDLSSGEKVDVLFLLSDNDGQLVVDRVKITNIAKTLNQAADVTYSEEQVREFLQKDIEVKSKLSGAMSLFDPDKNKLRELKLIEVKSGAKKFGDLYICRVNFEDVETKEMIGVDMQVKSEMGHLVIANIFIRERNAAQ